MLLMLIKHMPMNFAIEISHVICEMTRRIYVTIKRRKLTR